MAAENKAGKGDEVKGKPRRRPAARSATSRWKRRVRPTRRRGTQAGRREGQGRFQEVTAESRPVRRQDRRRPEVPGARSCRKKTMQYRGPVGPDGVAGQAAQPSSALT